MVSLLFLFSWGCISVASATQIAYYNCNGYAGWLGTGDWYWNQNNANCEIDGSDSICHILYGWASAQNSFIDSYGDFNTVGYYNIKARYKLYFDKTNSGTSCNLEYSTNGGSSWIIANTHNTAGSVIAGVFVFPSSADNNANFRIRFHDISNYDGEDACYINDVYIETVPVTAAPTQTPETIDPTKSPTYNPTPSPVTSSPTGSPTKNPTNNPSKSPTTNPTSSPVTSTPTGSPSKNPTNNPSTPPTKNPTMNPSSNPTNNPSTPPTKNPTQNPTTNPTRNPTPSPIPAPTPSPTQNPTKYPSKNPTTNPTGYPSTSPTRNPTNNPTDNPTPSPIPEPTPSPTINPTKYPTLNPITKSPTNNPITSIPTTPSPTLNPTLNPTTYSPTSEHAVGDATTLSPTANTSDNLNASDGKNDSNLIYVILFVGLAICTFLACIGLLIYKRRTDSMIKNLKTQQHINESGIDLGSTEILHTNANTNMSNSNINNGEKPQQLEMIKIQSMSDDNVVSDFISNGELLVADEDDDTQEEGDELYTSPEDKQDALKVTPHGPTPGNEKQTTGGGSGMPPSGDMQELYLEDNDGDMYSRPIVSTKK